MIIHVQNVLSQIKLVTLVVVIATFGSYTFAGAPSQMTFQAKIFAPNGNPLEASSVNFRFTILDSVGTCILYVEDFPGVNMTGSKGIISLPLGAGTKQFPTTATNLYEVFNNSTPSYPCQAGGTYSPTSTENRQMVMQFNDGAGWQTLPQAAINGVPYANYATRAEYLGNYIASAYLRPTTLPTCTGSQALTWNGTTFTCVNASGGGGGTSVTQNGNAFSADLTIGTTDSYGLKFNTNGSTRMVINAAGNIGIGTTTPSAALDLSATSTPQFKAGYDDSNYYTTGVSSFGTVTFDANGSFPQFSFNDALGITANSATASIYGLHVTRNLTDPTPQNYQYGSLLDVTRNAATSGVVDRIYGQRTNVTRTGATSASNTVAYGNQTTISNTGASSGIISTFGNHISVTGDTNGTSYAYGDYIQVSGADSNYGSYILMTPSASTTSYGLYVDAGAAAGTKYAAVFANGNVGIGTSSPAYALDVVGDVNVTGNFRVNGAVFSGGGGGGAMSGVTSISNASGDITLAPAVTTGAVQINSGAASIGTSTGALIINGGVGVSGGVNAGGAINTTSSISAGTSVLTPQLYGSSAANGNILIDGTSHATKGNVLLATAGGNVGVGTATPIANLDVLGTNGFGTIATRIRTTGGQHGLVLSNSATGGSDWYMGAADNAMSSGGSKFYLSPSSTASGAAMVVTTSGNVGIGTLTPTYALTVAGNTMGLGAGLISIQSDGTIKVGSGNTAGYSSVAFGRNNGLGGGNSANAVAVGISNSADHDGTLAVGISNNVPYGGGMMAVGLANTAAATGSVAIGMNITNNTASSLQIGPNDAAKITIASTGNVGIGTTTPSEKLEVSGNVKSTGQMYSVAQTSSAASPLTFNTNGGNLMVWTNASSALTANIQNMKPGGSYMLVVNGAGTGQVTINCYSDAGSTSLPSSFVPANGSRTNGTLNKSVYTIVSDGTNCLVTWITGF